MELSGIKAKSVIGHDVAISSADDTQTVEPPKAVFVEQGTHA